MRKFYVMVVFNSWSDFPQRSPRFAISNCCSQSSQIWRRCQWFCLRSCWWIEHAHLPQYSIDMLGVQFISVVAPFARRRWFIAWTWNFHFPSTDMCICMIRWPTVKPLYMFELSTKPLHQVVLDDRVLPMELWLRVIGLAFSMPMLGYHYLNPIFISLIRNLVEFPLERALPMSFAGIVHSCSIH
jgi:hypothetical protein